MLGEIMDGVTQKEEDEKKPWFSLFLVFFLFWSSWKYSGPKLGLGRADGIHEPDLKIK